MTPVEYFAHKELQEAVTAYAEKNGGSFFWEEPGGGFVYELEDAAFHLRRMPPLSRSSRTSRVTRRSPSSGQSWRTRTRMSSTDPMMKASC